MSQVVEFDGYKRARPWTQVDVECWQSLMDRGVAHHAEDEYLAADRCFMRAREVADKGLRQSEQAARRRSAAVEDMKLETIALYAVASVHVARNDRCWGKLESAKSAFRSGIQRLVPLMEDEGLHREFRLLCLRRLRCLTGQLAWLMRHTGDRQELLDRDVNLVLARMQATADMVVHAQESPRLH